MRHVVVGLALVTSGSSIAEATTTCTYPTSYNSPFLGGSCHVDAVAGCPLHFVVIHGDLQDPSIQVIRNGQLVQLPATLAVVGSTTATLPVIDYFSCDCHVEPTVMQFDQIELTVTGALEGDEVRVGGDSIIVGPAQACTAPAWPTMFEAPPGACDRCPIDGDPEPGGPAGGGAGCATGGATGWAALLALVAISRGLRAAPRPSARGARPRGRTADRAASGASRR